MRRWLGVLFAAAMVGCSAGGGGGTSATLPTASKPQMGTLDVRITIPVPASAGANAKLRRVYSAASATSGILFVVYPHGGNPSTQALATTGADISSANTTTCTTSGTSRTCTVAIVAPVGTNDVLAQTYDQVIPANGTVPATAHLLSAGTTPSVTITSGASNTVGVTLNPVLASVSLASNPSAIHAMLPNSNITISVYGYDAASNLILTGGYVDSSGNPVSVTLTTTLNPNNAFTLTASPVSASGAVAKATYNGAANTTGSIQVSTVSPYASTLSIGLLAPQVFAVSDSRLIGNPTTYQGIAVYSQGSSGPDYVFYTQPSYNSIAYIEGGSNGANAGVPASQTPVPLASPAGPISGGIVQDPTSSFYYAGGPSYNTQYRYIQSSPPPLQPQVSVTCSPSTNASCATTGGMALDGANGHVEYGSGQYVDDWTPGSTAVALNATPIAGTPQWGGFSFDTGSNSLWFCDFQSGTGNVYQLVLPGSTPNTPTASIGASPFDVSSDPPTGGAFVTVPSLKRVLFYQGALPSASVTTFNTTGTPQYVSDDVANATWISETSPSGQVIVGRIDPTSHVLGEYTIPSVSGGQAGPIVLLNYANVVAVVHYGGAGAGEVLLVVP